MQDNETGTEKKAAPPAGNGRRRRVGMILFLLIAVSAIAGLRWWIMGSSRITTDNAFVESHIHSVAGRVGGMVRTVAVRENQAVRRGDLLLEIDPSDYSVRVAESAAALEVTMNETSGDYARVEQSRAELQQSRARLAQAESDLKRGSALFAREVIPKEQLERLETGRSIAAALVSEKEENLKRYAAEAGLSASGNREAKAAQRRAQLEEARLNLSYTRLTAPVDGYVTRKTVEPGNYIQPGQPLMAIVPLEDAWVTANYKESQLTHVRPGQKVEFKVDAYPGGKFTGRVESIMAGTGAAFSLLPPENATGNYVKVVQRIPVRIAIDRQSDPEHLLRVGMSVVPTIITGKTVKEIIADLFSRE
ncbi:MAG TPA: HlyD family secretion protein [Geobacteraceae bacterium]|nr:HlyD family secretion protein [Geobacteraceae bacterium]